MNWKQLFSMPEEYKTNGKQFWLKVVYGEGGVQYHAADYDPIRGILRGSTGEGSEGWISTDNTIIFWAPIEEGE